MRKIYVASSWRNTEQPKVVERLRYLGHEVYDFRDPPCEFAGFHWSELDPDWQEWTAKTYRESLLNHPRAAQGFLSDLRAMMWCDTCVLVLPCGRSAHLELGWCAGAGKRTYILLKDGEEPELMNLLADELLVGVNELEVAFS